jgi:hypothetical protein
VSNTLGCAVGQSAKSTALATCGAGPALRTGGIRATLHIRSGSLEGRIKGSPITAELTDKLPPVRTALRTNFARVGYCTALDRFLQRNDFGLWPGSVDRVEVDSPGVSAVCQKLNPNLVLARPFEPLNPHHPRLNLALTVLNHKPCSNF